MAPVRSVAAVPTVTAANAVNAAAVVHAMTAMANIAVTAVVAGAEGEAEGSAGARIVMHDGRGIVAVVGGVVDLGGWGIGVMRGHVGGAVTADVMAGLSLFRGGGEGEKGDRDGE